MKNVATVFHLRFRSGLRQGALTGDVNRQTPVVTASTLWGGVGWAAVSLFGPEITENLVKSCRMSSLLWKRGPDYFVPMPIFPAKGMDLNKKKLVKKIRWIPVGSVTEVLSGDFEFPEDLHLFVEETAVSAALDRNTQAAVPFFRRRLRPAQGVEGVVVAEGPEDLMDYLKASFRLLKDTGLGGERSSGWGVFDLKTLPANETALGPLLTAEGDRYLVLGAFIPAHGEVKRFGDQQEYTGYDLWRLRGYVGASDVVKPTVLCIGHGALLPFRPQGQVIDITPAKTEHPVLFNGSPPSLAVRLPEYGEAVS
jgi:CRISPR-associated protein Csm4